MAMSAFFENHELRLLRGQKDWTRYGQPQPCPLGTSAKARAMSIVPGKRVKAKSVLAYVKRNGLGDKIACIDEVSEELKRINNSINHDGRLGRHHARPDGLYGWGYVGYKPLVIDGSKIYFITATLANTGWSLGKAENMSFRNNNPILLWRKPVVVIGSGAFG